MVFRWVSHFHFLIATPVVNEIALAMLFGLFGAQIAALYLVTGLIIAILGGVIIGRMRPERFVADFCGTYKAVSKWCAVQALLG